MLDLEYELKGICRRNRDGSRMTQAQRQQRLKMIARELDSLGYKHLRAASLKPKHVRALVDHWHEKRLSEGTIKNRMADLRWWAEKTGKPQAVAHANDHYGIARRVYVTNQSKARELPTDALAKVSDQRVAMSLRLQAAFGLRCEESIKFIPSFADHGDHLQLKASWCKGGRAREIPIRTDQHRALLDQAAKLAGSGSLIPAHLRYIDQRRRYERECVKAGLDRMHGLRHAYAQARYQELCGWAAPPPAAPPAASSPQSKNTSTARRGFR
jgi:Integrase/Phage integrase, N-terminal